MNNTLRFTNGHIILPLGEQNQIEASKFHKKCDKDQKQIKELKMLELLIKQKEAKIGTLNQKIEFYERNQDIHEHSHTIIPEQDIEAT